MVHSAISAMNDVFTSSDKLHSTHVDDKSGDIGSSRGNNRVTGRGSGIRSSGKRDFTRPTASNAPSGISGIEFIVSICSVMYFILCG